MLSPMRRLENRVDRYLTALLESQGEGGGGCGSGWEGHRYTGGFKLMYGKNHHNIVK